ncbi:MAG: AAA family ATPase [Candidatus Asgardarchaeia archaeon]
MIKTLLIRNFKSIKELLLECKRINLFIGEPNTGKSNILEVIGFLSHLYHGKISDFIRFESLINLFYDNDLSEEITIQTDSKKVMIKFRNGKFLITASENGKESLLTSYTYSDLSQKVAIDDFRKFKFYRFQKLKLFPNQRSDYLVPPHGENLLTVILTHKKLKSVIKQILDNFGYRLVLNPPENKIAIQKELEDIIVAFPYHLLSETLQRIIFFLTILHSNENSIIAFEEPEAHAFPYYTKFIAERIALDNKNNQFFVSTHNPYFVISILEKSPKGDVNVSLTYLDNYQTKVKTLTQQEIEELLDLGTDFFFNIETFLE